MVDMARRRGLPIGEGLGTRVAKKERLGRDEVGVVGRDLKSKVGGGFALPFRVTSFFSYSLSRLYRNLSAGYLTPTAMRGSSKAPNSPPARVLTREAGGREAHVCSVRYDTSFRGYGILGCLERGSRHELESPQSGQAGHESAHGTVASTANRCDGGRGTLLSPATLATSPRTSSSSILSFSQSGPPRSPSRSSSSITAPPVLHLLYFQTKCPPQRPSVPSFPHLLPSLPTHADLLLTQGTHRAKTTSLP